MLITTAVSIFISFLIARIVFHYHKKDMTRKNAFHICSIYFLNLILLLCLSYTLRTLSLNHNYTHKLPLLPQAYSVHIFLFSLNLLIGFSSSLLVLITLSEKRDRLTSVLAVSIILISINFIYLTHSSSPQFKEKIEHGAILQSDPMSCAAAAFANIAKSHQYNLSEKTSAEAMGTTIQGTSPAQIVLGARKLGFEAEIFHKLSIDKLETSSILFVDAPLGKEKHAVAFIEKRGDDFLIIDPDKGAFLWPENFLQRRWHGNGIYIKPKHQ